MNALIHPSAVIEEGAVLGEGVSVGPFSVIGKGAKIGRGTKILSSVVIEGSVEMGENCTIYPFTSIGLPPQDLKYKGEDTSVRIGNNNIIREYISIHRASVGGDGATVIGDDNFLMAYVHIAHDCKLGNHIIMANAATLGGHVLVEDGAVMGGIAAVHQHARIGTLAMVGGFSGISQDIPPYTMASGARAKLYGLNIVGLKRNGFSDEKISELKQAYKILFREKCAMKEAIKKVQEELPYTEEIARLLEFIQQNKRGICR